MFPKNAWLPRLTDFSAQVPAFRGLTTHLGLVLAIIAAVVVWLILYRSHWGYEIRLIGDNPNAARYAGISIARNTVLVMMVSGALAGLAGMSEITGVVHRLQGAISPGYGFTGIIVAWLAKLNPFAVILVSILFGALILAGREIQPSGSAQADPGHHPGVPDRQRFLPALPHHASFAAPRRNRRMDLLIVLQAGVATGTVLLFATLGEIFAERSGVMNLGVEGMMLIGAMSAFSIAVATGNPWLGMLVAMLAAGLISQVHAFITITLQADQVVSGLALNFMATGISLVLGRRPEQSRHGRADALL